MMFLNDFSVYNKQNTNKPSLLRAIFKTFWRELMITQLLYLMNDVIIRLVQPILLGELLLYFR